MEKPVIYKGKLSLVSNANNHSLFYKDLVLSSSSPVVPIPETSTSFIDVKSFGAKGDGANDDTEAIEKAMKQGYKLHLPVVFPYGTYLIRRPLTLRSNMEVYGLNNPTIKKQKAVTTTLTQQLQKGSNTLHVKSASGFKVGDALTISNDANGQAAARHCSVGTVTDVNTAENIITFSSAYESIGVSGAIKTHAVGCYVTTSCAIIRSWGMLYPCENTFVHNLTLDGNRQEDEFGDWHNGVIHIDATSGTVEGVTYKYAANNNTFRDLIIKNSPFDGISDQGDGEGTIENCKIINSKMHGIHFGTNYKNATVLNNDIYKCLQDGIFWCQGVHNIIIKGNHIEECNKGCSDKEYGTAAYHSIIDGNIFQNIVSYIFDFSLTGTDPGYMVISNNIIRDCNDTVLYARNRNKILLTSNLISNFSTKYTTDKFLFDMSAVTNSIFSLNSAIGAEKEKIFKDVTPEINVNNTWNI